MKKNELVIPEYLAYLKMEAMTPVEIHHWVPRSKIGRNDFFVCAISPGLHQSIHQERSVSWYIDEIGIENLLLDSATQFAVWLGELAIVQHDYFKLYKDMIRRVAEDPANFEHVLSATRECASLIQEVEDGKTRGIRESSGDGLGDPREGA